MYNGPIGVYDHVLRKLEFRAIFFKNTVNNSRPNSWWTPQALLCFHRHQGPRWRRSGLFFYKRPPACPSVHTTQSLQTLQQPTSAALCASHNSAAPVSPNTSSLLSPAESRGVPAQSSWIIERKRLGSLALLSAIITEPCSVCCFFNLPPLCNTLS